MKPDEIKKNIKKLNDNLYLKHLDKIHDYLKIIDLLENMNYDELYYLNNLHVKKQLINLKNNLEKYKETYLILKNISEDIEKHIFNYLI